MLRFLEAGQGDALPVALLVLCLGLGLAVWWGRASRRRKRRALWACQRDLATLQAMTWQEFEQLVGETFRCLGFQINETGGGGADGGLDLLMTRNGKTYAVQCKHYARKRVGAPIVREAVGVAVHVRASGAYVVTVGGFTRAAKDYARGKPVHLVDGAALLGLIEQGRSPRKTQARG